MDAAKLWVEAYRFHYKRGGNSGVASARIIYNQIIDQFPDSVEAGYAHQQLAIIRDQPEKDFTSEAPHVSQSSNARENASTTSSRDTTDAYDGGIRPEWVCMVIMAFIILGLGIYVKDLSRQVAKDKYNNWKEQVDTSIAIQDLKDREQYRRSHNGAEPPSGP